jgi:hypothetical protein
VSENLDRRSFFARVAGFLGMGFIAPKLPTHYIRRVVSNEPLGQAGSIVLDQPIAIVEESEWAAELWEPLTNSPLVANRRLFVGSPLSREEVTRLFRDTISPYGTFYSAPPVVTISSDASDPPALAADWVQFSPEPEAASSPLDPPPPP